MVLPLPLRSTTPTPQPHHISVSQIENHIRCPRWWWLTKVAHFPKIDRPYFRFGKALHGVTERRLLGQDDLYPPGWAEGLTPQQIDQIQDLVEVAIRAGCWDQVPGSQVEVPFCFLVGEEWLQDGIPLVAEARTQETSKGEREILPPTCLVSGEPLPRGWNRLPYFVGFIDYYLPPAQVGDHKTAKNRRYGKSKADIRGGLQLPIYGCHVINQAPYLDAVEGKYTVLLKDPDATKPVYVVEDFIPRTHIEATWRRVIQEAKQMEEERQIPRLGQRPDKGPDRDDRANNYRQIFGAIDSKNESIIRGACDAYGECPARDACFGRCQMAQVIRRIEQENAGMGCRNNPTNTMVLPLKPTTKSPAS